MHIQIGIENYPGYRSLAWVLGHPGCFTYGADASSAVVSAARAFLAYKSWIGRHTDANWLSDIQDVDVRLSEVWDVYTVDDDFEVVPEGRNEINAWFRHDWKPLTRLEVQRGLKVLSFSRGELMETVRGLPAEVLDRSYPDERWSIRGILNHIGGAEWWYMDRLGQAGLSRREVPEDPFERLELVRRRLEAVVPELEGVNQVAGVNGEFWSPRKVLRRAAWHELDHLEHIKKLLAISS